MAKSVMPESSTGIELTRVPVFVISTIIFLEICSSLGRMILKGLSEDWYAVGSKYHYYFEEILFLY